MSQALPLHIRLGIVDDHEVVRQGLSVHFSGHSRIRVHAARPVASGLHGETLDVVLLDLRLGDGSSVNDNVAAIARTGATTIAYTSGENPDHLRAAARANVAGMVRKSESLAALEQAILMVNAGETLGTPEWASAIASDPDLPSARLSRREVQVLELYAAGLPASDVATALFISPQTVADHVKGIRRKYRTAGRGASTKLELFHRAVEDGYLTPPTSRSD
ncbi:response regulator transcription factor [Pseudoclavibacter terrae]|uniref:response regulator transcription factor n=1 Tax=Pseudoclavibacter terrae TaxID=1530195 RepID=UPI00232EC545|nr:LuxR C-terminal-related transcriptional regulator [Pseudoclavibacter terrae]